MSMADAITPPMTSTMPTAFAIETGSLAIKSATNGPALLRATNKTGCKHAQNKISRVMCPARSIRLHGLLCFKYINPALSMETDSSSAAAGTSIEYTVAYGRASSLEEALEQMKLGAGEKPSTLGTSSTNSDVDENTVLTEALERSESVIAEVQVTRREGPKRVKRSVFIYAALQSGEIEEMMAGT